MLAGREETEAQRTKVEYLLEADLFRGLTDDDLAEVERSTSMTTTPRGTVFFSPDEHQRNVCGREVTEDALIQTTLERSKIPFELFV